MAVDIKASRVIVFALATIVIAVGVFYKNFSTPALPFATAAETCAPIPANIKFLGPAMTIAQAEKLSLAKMAAAPPTVPRVPFGHLNSEWLELRHLSKATDTVHEFRTELSGGHLILRGSCLIGELPGWIR
mgnify:CR=1 FL=1